MYLPKYFIEENWDSIAQHISENSFATVISYSDNKLPTINHFPLSLNKDQKVLFGHMSKSNSQWQEFKNNSCATILIHGPHAYISPKWYKSGRDVPTWNYVAIHLQGHVDLIEDFQSQVKIIKKLTETFETEDEHPWSFLLPSDLNTKDSLCSAIISFRFTIEHIEAKFKLSQNRSELDRQGVIEGLLQEGSELSCKIAHLMKQKQNQ